MTISINSQKLEYFTKISLCDFLYALENTHLKIAKLIKSPLSNIEGYKPSLDVTFGLNPDFDSLNLNDDCDKFFDTFIKPSINDLIYKLLITVPPNKLIMFYPVVNNMPFEHFFYEDNETGASLRLSKGTLVGSTDTALNIAICFGICDEPTIYC